MQLVFVATVVVVKTILPELTEHTKQRINFASREFIGILHHFRQFFAGHEAQNQMEMVRHYAKSQEFDAVLRSKVLPRIHEDSGRCIRSEDRPTKLHRLSDGVAREVLGEAAFAKFGGSAFQDRAPRHGT
jgi:hypothetical protein